MDWIVSGLALYSMWLLGHKRRSGWLYRAASQGIWIALAIRKELWGFLPLAVFAGVLALRNFYLWSKEASS